MTPECFEQIEELYHAARAKSGEERRIALASPDHSLR